MYRPQIVHFAIALLVTGVVFRLVSLSGKLAFTNPSALVLILAGTVAAVLAAKSGTEAHGPVERIPGARAAVQEHENGESGRVRCFSSSPRSRSGRSSCGANRGRRFSWWGRAPSM